MECAEQGAAGGGSSHAVCARLLIPAQTPALAQQGAVSGLQVVTISPA